MKKRKIYSLVLGSIILIAVFSIVIYAKPFSNPAKTFNNTEQKANNENSKTDIEKPKKTDEVENASNQDSNEPSEINTENEVKWGKVNVRVYYSTTSFLPNLPVQYAVVELESEDGTVQRKGVTNLQGRTTFRLLPTEHDYILKVSKDHIQISEELLVMDSDSKANYEIVFF